MGINLQNTANFIHSQPPARLDGLFQAAHAKFTELGLKLGRRDSLAADVDPSTPVTGNVRSLVNWIASIEAITDDDKPSAEDAITAEDNFAAGDSHEVLTEKNERRRLKADRANARAQRLAAKEADHAALRKLYGTLAARYAASGYKAPVPLPAAEETFPVPADPPALT